MKHCFMLLMPLLANASETDILPRSVNFIIFAVILYFLVVKHVRKLYYDKIIAVESRLSTLELNMQESKNEKDEAIKNVHLANEEAKQMMLNAQELLLTEKSSVLNEAEKECKTLERALNEKMHSDKKAAKLEVIDKLLTSALSNKVALSENELLKVISKRLGNG